MSKIIRILKSWRIWLLIIVILFSIYALVPVQTQGVTVSAISPDSPLLAKLRVGDIIDWANEKTITSPEDLEEFETFTGVFRFSRNGNLELIQIEEPGLKIRVRESDTSKLTLGMDLVGGTRVLLQPEENVSSEIIQQTLATLQTRVNVYGLRESKFQVVEDVEKNKYIQIEMAGGSIGEVEELLAKQGEFSGKISKPVQLIGGTGIFWGKEVIKVNCTKETNLTACVEIDGEMITDSISTEINGIEFTLLEIENSTATLLGETYTTDDIRSVCIQDQPGVCASRLIKQENGWEFSFQVFIEKTGAEKFALLTEDSKILTDPTFGGSYLDSKLYLFLDEEKITDLSIATGLAGQAYQEPLLTGFRETKEEALTEKLKLQSILQSGVLPVKMSIVKIDQVSATLGEGFVNTAMLAGLGSAIAVSLIIFLRYRKLKISIPVLVTSLSEVIIILGVAASIRWTIDLAAIAGIIAAVGTGVDSQIMILDEILIGSEIVYTLKQKLKRAFFIIMGSAATTIAAMIPLMVIGIGVMRGFAIITTIGVLTGIMITRPAFGKIAEILLEKEAIESSTSA